MDRIALLAGLLLAAMAAKADAHLPGGRARAWVAPRSVRAPRSVALPLLVISPLTGRMRPARLPIGAFDLGAVNPAGVSPFNNNCVFSSIATDLSGKGIPAVAFPKLWPTADAVLANLYGPPRSFASPLEVALTAFAEGPGYMGIVTSAVAGSRVGHAFNVENVGGQVLFLDGQSGTMITDLGRFFYLRLFDTR